MRIVAVRILANPATTEWFTRTITSTCGQFAKRCRDLGRNRDRNRWLTMRHATTHARHLASRHVAAMLAECKAVANALRTNVLDRDIDLQHILALRRRAEIAR